MVYLKRLFTVGSVLVLMILRCCVPETSTDWLGSVTLAGVFVAWMDLIQKFSEANRTISSRKSKGKFVITFVILGVVAFAVLCLILINSVNKLEKLNQPLVQDELTLFALLLCVGQNGILSLLNWIVLNK